MVCHVVEGVLTTTGADVAVLVAVPFQTAVDAREKAKAPEIELPLVHEERVVDILLNDESSFAIFSCRPPDDLLHISDCFYDGDALASISILTRFDDPSVLSCPVLFMNLLYGFFIV